MRTPLAMERELINPWSWQGRFGFVQAQAVRGAERTIYCSGQTSMDAEGNPMHEGDMAAQLVQALDNLESVLAESGCGLSNVGADQLLHNGPGRFFRAMEVLTAQLEAAGCSPAFALLDVSRLARPPLLLELEATAVV